MTPPAAGRAGDEAAAVPAYLGPYVFAYQHGFRLLTEQVTLGGLMS